MKGMKYKSQISLWEKILLGFPNGIQAKSILVDRGEAKYTLWDKIRHRLYTGERLKNEELKKGMEVKAYGIVRRGPDKNGHAYVKFLGTEANKAVSINAVCLVVVKKPWWKFFLPRSAK